MVVVLSSALGCAQGVEVDTGEGANAGGAMGTPGAGGQLVTGAGATGGSTAGSGGFGGTGSNTGGAGGTAAGGAGQGGAPPLAQDCPAGEFATGFDAQGTLQCAAIDATAQSAVNSACTLYAGWRDSCDGCTTAPAKWGRSTATTCSNGLGANNTCTTPNLGGVTVDAFGLNTDGDVDGNDKFYIGLDCVAPADLPSAGPCAVGEFVAGYNGSSVQCVTGEAAATSYVANQCEIYFGWRDNCDGCTSSPAKWGRTGTNTCTNGVGLHNTCTTPNLGGDLPRLFGLNPDGDVDGNDKFYIGFHCEGATPAGGAVAQDCPTGQLMTGVNVNGTIDCADPAPQVEAVVRNDCFVYYGWRDSCDGCTTAPSKWGRVNSNICENGVGVDNTCQTSPLNATSVRLFGLNTDGSVNGDDKFYTALMCP